MKNISDFKFIGVTDYGNASCPHCGAEGRYIYYWEMDGEKYAAMAGCYKKLTGKLEKGEVGEYMVLLAEKQAKGKKLNGWDESILRLQNFLKEGKYPEKWINEKIEETLMDRKKYLTKNRYLRIG